MLTKVSMTFLVHGDNDLDKHSDDVFEELLKLEAADSRLSDSDMDAVLAERVVTISVMAEADGFDDCLDLASSAIRSAIHAAGGATPGWNHNVPETSPVEYKLQDQRLVAA